MSRGFFASEIQLGSRVIGRESRPYLVAEIGINHGKNLQLAGQMIAAAAKAGADAVKFQSYTSRYFIHPEIAEIRPLYDIFAGLELDFEQHQALAAMAANEGLDFFSTPLSPDWPAKLSRLQVPCFKIASGDLNNFQLLAATLKEKKPMLISTGASSQQEILRAAAFLQSMNQTDVIFLHCVSLYPTPLDKANLATISQLQQNLDVLAGFSDHTSGHEAAFAAASLGAVLIEKHFTLDKNLPGPDHAISADPAEFASVRRQIDLAYSLRGQARTLPLPEEIKGDFFGKRSLYHLNGATLALRPRQPGLPADSDFLTETLSPPERYLESK